MVAAKGPFFGCECRDSPSVSFSSHKVLCYSKGLEVLIFWGAFKPVLTGF